MPPADQQRKTHWTRDAILGFISLVVLAVAVLLGVQIAQNHPAEVVPSNNAQVPQQVSQNTEQPAAAPQPQPQQTTTSLDASGTAQTAGPSMPAPGAAL